MRFIHTSANNLVDSIHSITQHLQCLTAHNPPHIQRWLIGWCFFNYLSSREPWTGLIGKTRKVPANVATRISGITPPFIPNIYPTICNASGNANGVGLWNFENLKCVCVSVSVGLLVDNDCPVIGLKSGRLCLPLQITSQNTDRYTGISKGVRPKMDTNRFGEGCVQDQRFLHAVRFIWMT